MGLQLKEMMKSLRFRNDNLETTSQLMTSRILWDHTEYLNFAPKMVAS